MLLPNIHNRWQAFGVHLAISGLIFLVLLTLILLVWYPGPFIQAGGYQGIKIVAGVDLVLGPLLTLVVFNRAKPSLKWDLSAIAALQCLALGAGTWIVHSERPIFQVLDDNGLHILTTADFTLWGSSIPKQVLTDLEGHAPYPVSLNLPEEKEKRALRDAIANITGQAPAYMDWSLYQQTSAETIDRINQLLTGVVREYDGEPSTSNCQWVPIRSEHLSENAIACYDPWLGALKIVDRP